MYLKRERDNQKKKVLSCIDGRPQHEYIGREETISYIVSIHALFSSCTINAIAI